MKPKIVGDRTSPDSIPTRHDKHKYYRKYKMSEIEHPRTQYQHIMITTLQSQWYTLVSLTSL